MFDKGLQISPLDADLNYALCILYINSNQIEKAKEYGLVLKKYYSSNPDYQRVIQQLGLLNQTGSFSFNSILGST